MIKKLLVIVKCALLITMTGVWAVSAESSDSLPPSLDQYYQTIPPVYLTNMWDNLAAPMMGIIVNIQAGDMDNATASYNAFSDSYRTTADMVPEWRKYYNVEAVDAIGVALHNNDIPGVFQAVGEVGNTCSGCHEVTMSAVWNKYNWGDFRTVNVNTPEGPLPWSQAKMNYLDVGISGIGANIKEGDQAGALQSFNLFRSMFDNMTEACSECHGPQRPNYFVSDDIQVLIADMGEKIEAGDAANLSAAAGIIPVIGSESCYKCHILHVPAQFAKEFQDCPDPLPASIDKYYANVPPNPPIFTIKMFEMAESMVGIVANIQQGDMENATNSYEAFSQNYEYSATLVPEWQSFYDPQAVEQLGNALNNNNIPGVFQAMGEVGQTCSECHIRYMPSVWYQYIWKDFRTIDINTPEGPLPFSEAKMKFMAPGYDGIGVFIGQGDKAGAEQSLALFRSMFESINESCGSCHDSERKYYVSDDIRKKIDDMEAEIAAGNLDEAGELHKEIGMESCYRCHVLHMPAQIINEVGFPCRQEPHVPALSLPGLLALTGLLGIIGIIVLRRKR